MESKERVVVDDSEGDGDGRRERLEKDEEEDGATDDRGSSEVQHVEVSTRRRLTTSLTAHADDTPAPRPSHPQSLPRAIFGTLCTILLILSRRDVLLSLPPPLRAFPIETESFSFPLNPTPTWREPRLHLRGRGNARQTLCPEESASSNATETKTRRDD